MKCFLKLFKIYIGMNDDDGVKDINLGFKWSLWFEKRSFGEKPAKNFVLKPFDFIFVFLCYGQKKYNKLC